MVEIELSWLLGVVSILGASIVSLAGLVYKLLSNRIRVQDTIIHNLQRDVSRLSKGCGVSQCLFKTRSISDE